MSINHVVISGNLTRDPELRQTASGMAILTLGIAVNDRRKNPQTGEWEDVPNYFTVKVFGKRAESLESKLAKGSKVYVDGRLSWSQWESNGEKRSKVEIIANVFEYERRNDRDAQPAQQSLYDDDIPF